MKRDLRPLMPTRPGWPSTLRIACAGCGVSCAYDVAVATGWRFDMAGIPFEAYYCPVCTQLVGQGGTPCATS